MNADAVADVIARAQHAVARARRLTETYQSRLGSNDNQTLIISSTPIIQQLANAAAFNSGEPSYPPSTPAEAAPSSDERDGSPDNRYSFLYTSPHADSTPAASEQQRDGDANTPAHLQQPSSPPAAMDALVERLVSMPLISASHKLAQLHDQQASTLRQLLELRSDQLR